ncbi:MAG: hypothetical protein IPP32_16665 [Bacteroidetes bacterium]|nr:hypothetical protein [Bacteroidota bacterium]
MTAQMGDTLHYLGESYSIATEPLKPYLDVLQTPIQFEPPHTACWRGYYASWEIKGDLLLLMDFTGFVYSNRRVNIDYIFPGEPVVFANWFSGEIRVPLGNTIKYIHAGYASVNERDLFLQFDAGRLVGSKTQENSYEEELDDGMPF